MNAGLTLVMLFTVMMIAAAAGLVGWVVYLDAQAPSAPREEAPPEAASTIPSTSTSTTIAPPEPSSTTLNAPEETTSSTTTTTLRAMTADYQPKTIYLEDDVNVTATGSDGPVRGVTIYLDGVLESYSGDDVAWIRSIQGGGHTVTAAADGYYNESFNLTVQKTTYSGSRDVRRELTGRERQAAIASGKADFRFYDSPGCVNCRAVLSYLNHIIDKNRDCVVYEKMWAYDHPQEIQSFFGKGTVQFPLIIVDGPRGTRQTQGVVSANHIRDMIRQTTGCEVQ